MENLCKDIQEKILKNLSCNVEQFVYDIYFSELKITDIFEDTIYIYIGDKEKLSQFKKNKNFVNDLQNAIRDANKNIINFKFVDTKEDKAKNNLNNQKLNNLNYNLNLNPNYTFENFVVGECNRIARTVALNFITTDLKDLNPLIIYSDVGLGKTHLLSAIGNEIIRNFPSKKIVYTTTESLLNEYIYSLKNNNTTNYYNQKYRNLDFFLVDDFQFIENKKNFEESFFHIFNELYNKQSKIVICMDKNLQDLEISDRLKSRLQKGFNATITVPDNETKLYILKNKSSSFKKGIIKDEILNYIAELDIKNIRELEGYLNNLYYTYIISNETSVKPIDLAYAKEIIEQKKRENNSKITSEFIISKTCEYFNIKEKDILSQKRNKDFSFARHICIYLLLEYLSYPKTAVAKIFNRDHSTIIHSEQKIKSSIKKNDKEIIDIIRNIKAILEKNI